MKILQNSHMIYFYIIYACSAILHLRSFTQIQYSWIARAWNPYMQCASRLVPRICPPIQNRWVNLGSRSAACIFPQSKTMKSQRKTKKSTNSFQRVASLTDSEESLEFVRQKRTARLVTSHWETQQHSDVNTNLAQFNKRLRFVSLQNQLAKAVCKSLLHDTNASLSD